jgi:hypothetical protein
MKMPALFALVIKFIFTWAMSLKVAKASKAGNKTAYGFAIKFPQWKCGYKT